MTSPEITAAAVLLFHPNTGDVLVEVHRDGVGLPGGHRELRDARPIDAAKRELFEETGVELYEARSILVYQAGSHLCEAFFASSHGPLPDSLELATRGAAFVSSRVLVSPRGRFPAYCSLMFAELAMLVHRRGEWRTQSCG